VSRVLVTTADETTWPKDKNHPVLFLGAWCQIFSRRSVWQSMDYKVASYHWDDREKLFIDYKYLQVLHEQLLQELTVKLNDIHSVNYSTRYWRILIGPWLGYFTQVLFDRWYMLKQVLEQQSFSECYITNYISGSTVANDMGDFNAKMVTDDWNEAIYGQLLEYCWPDEIKIEKASKAKTLKPTLIKDKQNKSFKSHLKKIVEKALLLFNRLASKEDGYFFISTYLPYKVNCRLQVALGQIPQLWRLVPAPITPVDDEQRRWHLESSNINPDTFDSVIRHFIPLHLPTLYLEGYPILVKKVEQLPWPRKPKAIFTSNSYSADDTFKAWSASKTELKIPLIIGQHGGNLGMTPFAFHEEHQITIADQWLSWGWVDSERPQIEPIGNLKDVSNNQDYERKGQALIVGMSLPRYSYHLFAIPISSQWLDYHKELILFLNTLPIKLRNQIVFRPYPAEYGWEQVARVKESFSEISIAPRQKNMRSLIKKSRIYISTYNATTYLESLNWNVPTIMFWNPNHWEIKPEVKPYFELLKSVGIFHESPESAAQQMIKVWDDVDLWWYSDDVQSVRHQFCQQFSKPLEDPIALLKEVFLNCKVN
jgi:putative transferase (TIGR04331 family)